MHGAASMRSTLLAMEMKESGSVMDAIETRSATSDLSRGSGASSRDISIMTSPFTLMGSLIFFDY